MAQFRLSLAIASRSAGRSVVAMAAYRAGCRLHDERAGRVHNYARRRGVAYAGIVLPDNAPPWASDREQLWNRVEEREGRSDAQLGREVQLSLPHELDREQRRELALAFARHLVAEYGFAVDVAIHTPGEQGDGRNHHAHLLLTSRAFDAGHKSGWARAKDRRFDAIAMRRAGVRNVVEGLRQVWETMQNAALASADVRDRNGEPVRVDRRSYERQGLNIEPAQHEGPDVTAIKRRDGCNRSIGHPLAGDGTGEKMGYKSHSPGTAQGIFDELEAGRRDFTGGGRRGLGLHRYRVGRSRQLAVFHAELSQEALNTDPQPDADPPLKVDLKSARSWRWSGLDELNRELSESAEEERKEERNRGSGRQLRLLDTDPRPKDFTRQIAPATGPERQSYRRGR